MLSTFDAPTDRRSDILHPSEMAKSNWCPRQSYYRIAGTPASNPTARRFSFQLESVFAEGHAIHAKWQAWLAEMGRLWGTWECLFCDETTVGTLTRVGTLPQHCPECGRVGGMSYREVPLVSERLGIHGHADGAVPDEATLIEIKSVGVGTLRAEAPELLAANQVESIDGKKIYDLDSLWKNMRRPFPSHIRQGQIYLGLCNEMGLPYDRIVFLYESKATQAFREFVVRYNPEITRPLFDAALDIKAGLKLGIPPARPERAESPESSLCKNCPWLSHCWSQERNDNDALPEGARVRRGEHAPVSRDAELPRLQSGAVPEASSSAGVSSGALSGRAEPGVRQARKTARMSDLRGRDRSEMATEEPGVGPEEPPVGRVRDDNGGVRRVVRRPRR